MSHETIPAMLDIMEKYNQGSNIREELSTLLDHPDYQNELERYGNHPMRKGFTKEEFLNFFINIRTLKSTDIESLDLKTRQKDLLEIMDNIEFYRSSYNKIKMINTKHLEEAIIIAKNGLPKSIDISGVHVMLIVGLGMSGGYIYKNNIMGDLKLIVSGDGPNLSGLMAHESHHLGLFKIMEKTDMSKQNVSLSTKLMLSFFGEGTAIKYCNNFEGKLTSKMYPNKSSDVVKQSFDYYLNNFDSIYNQLRIDLESLKNEKDEKKFEEIFMKNYFSFDIEINGILHENYLTQPICYFIGADIWGLIHDEFGIEKVFELFDEPQNIFSVYNRSLQNIGRKDLMIEM